MQSDFPTLRLPKRFEALEREAKNTGADISQIVQRIDSATARIETLVRQVRDGGLGRFELFLGKSGSGKTTFFKTLGHFFEGLRVLFREEEGRVVIAWPITDEGTAKTLSEAGWEIGRDSIVDVIT